MAWTPSPTRTSTGSEIPYNTTTNTMREMHASTEGGRLGGGGFPHPDSAVFMSFMEAQEGNSSLTDRDVGNVITLDHDGIHVKYTHGDIQKMQANLTDARADGLFPTTTALSDNVRATVDDHARLVSLNRVREAYHPEEWNQQPAVVDLLFRITRDIRARDKLAADKSEEDRVKAHLDNMMSGVNAEAKLYNIVKHAVTYAIKNGSTDHDAAVAGQNMAQLLNGIRGVIKEMGDKGDHGVHGVNIEAVLEDVFGMIDFALDGQAKQVDGRVKHMDGQIEHVDGQIKHLNAIGHHVNAIDGHVHSLGNNINSFGTLLNSTNGNVVSLTTQVALLQTIVNLIPRLVSDGVEQLLPEIIQQAFGPIVQALEAQLGVASNHSFGGVYGHNKKSILKKITSAFKKLFKKSF
ncbi:hypothetical protein F4821DRAFT_260713 [Hypoxylon rubiginosum]|uniref:Uncharacterized protein n=1 Tax=Hypoxylon rubiginosum TaxID=110542 RepID=A0ACC0CYN4_9PEZI|nr:hypothetical protein F4821DRAFT_260713 [Hypoxylon rubiginosum]